MKQFNKIPSQKLFIHLNFEILKPNENENNKSLKQSPIQLSTYIQGV